MLRALGLSVLLVTLVACGSQPKTPEQTYIDTFNSMNVGHQVKSASDKAALLQAGQAACTAAKAGASNTQIENDLSAVGITHPDLAHMIRLAAQAQGSLCP